MVTAAITFLIGMALIVAGSWMISPAWGLIASGIVLSILGVVFAQSTTAAKENKNVL